MEIGPHVGILLGNVNLTIEISIYAFNFLFVLKKRNLFITNYDMHNVHTRHSDNL
jgi:hypothetical protein